MQLKSFSSKMCFKLLGTESTSTLWITETDEFGFDKLTEVSQVSGYRPKSISQVWRFLPVWYCIPKQPFVFADTTSRFQEQHNDDFIVPF